MAGLAFAEFNALPDALGVDRFQILLAPAVASNSLNQTLALRCTQIALPSTLIEDMEVNIQGMTFMFRGRRQYGKKLGASFVETTDGAVTTAINSWKESIVGTESQNGATKKQYSTTGTLNVFDQSGNVVFFYLLDNMWPSEEADVMMDGAMSNALIKSITFTFDRFRFNGQSIK